MSMSACCAGRGSFLKDSGRGFESRRPPWRSSVAEHCVTSSDLVLGPTPSHRSAAKEWAYFFR
jgi:hypothetical protein